MKTKKRRTRSFDSEMLALGRAVREIEAFPDPETRSRMARYLADRFHALEARASGPYDRQPGETVEQWAERIWNTPIEGSPLADVPIDPRQEALELRPGNDPIRRIIEKASVCAHNLPIGEKCFGCEAEQLAKDRHSAPPAPVE